MTTTENPAHSVDFWAATPRYLEDIVVTEVQSDADSVWITAGCMGFRRSRTDLGREIRVGEHLALETVNVSTITGLRDANGWLFHMTDEDLAADARRFSEDLHRKDVERLEANRKKWTADEAALPDWLKARIQRFRDAAGEKFLLEGWGYELMICRLADLLDRGLEGDADELAKTEGATGNQWDCAKCLAEVHRTYGEESVAAVPAGLAPITGSVDYT